MEIGKKYCVEATDCCLIVSFEARLISLTGDGLWGTKWHFDNGITLECAGTNIEWHDAQG